MPRDGSSADVIVIGLGAAGSAVLAELARRGVSVLGIDRFSPPHDKGSSHGETRITRQANGEGDAYTPLALRSHELWRRLEEETGESLLRPVGALIMASGSGAAFHHGKGDFVRKTVAGAERYGIAHEVLTADEIARRFPQFTLRGDETGYFEPGAGFLRPERCIAAQLASAARHGAAIHTGEVVTALEPAGDGVRVVTDKGAYHADRVVAAAGAWLPGLVGAQACGGAKVHRQVLAWFEASEPELWTGERAPVFIWMHGDRNEDYLYGFPQLAAGAGVKVATEQYAVETWPDRVEREVGPAETEALYREHVAGRFRGLTGRCLKASVCLYTVTPDSDFLIGRHPAGERITLVSACSGHGFKHSAALGEAIAEGIVEGRSRIDLAAFGAARFAAAAAGAHLA